MQREDVLHGLAELRLGMLELHAPVIRELLLRRSEALAADAFIFAKDGYERPVGTPGLWRVLGRYCKLAGVPLVCPTPCAACTPH